MRGDSTLFHFAMAEENAGMPQKLTRLNLISDGATEVVSLRNRSIEKEASFPGRRRSTL
jgi:hypothetical protein